MFVCEGTVYDCVKVQRMIVSQGIVYVLSCMQLIPV